VGAAEDWQLAGNPARSWAVIRQVHEKSLYPALLARVEIVKASLYLAQHDPQMALQRLKFALTPLPPELKAKALLVRGQAHQAMGDLVAMVADWTERETYLPVGSPEVVANRDLIWNTLNETHTPIDVAKLPASLTPMARGWLELADI